MAARKLSASEVGLPRFEPGWNEDGEAFDLSSHKRAREALEFGISIADLGFNIFVIGEDRSGRMTASVEFLRKMVATRPPPGDWLYLNNFSRPHRPRPARVPAGIGRRFSTRMTELVPQLREALSRAFTQDDYIAKARGEGEKVRGEVTGRLEAVRREAQQHGLDIVQSPRGPMIVPAGGEGVELTPEQHEALEEIGHRFADELIEINRWAVRRQAELNAWMKDFDRQMANQAISAILDDIVTEFSPHSNLGRWLTEMREDVLDHIDIFHPSAAESGAEPPERRYAVNLLVDHAGEPHPPVVLDANPTYENLFGRISYRQVGGGLLTDFTMIRAGSLHRANGGVLVLRAEALAGNPTVWDFLKGALRDHEVRVEELHREGAVPVTGAPRPKPIPLDVKVVIVGAPRWHAAFFTIDPDFQTYFKVKAEIDPDMDATPENVACYAGMIRRMARQRGKARCAPEAVQRLLGIAARWAMRRDKLSSRFEVIEDVMSEAVLHANDGGDTVSEASVIAAMDNRRRRNARTEDRLLEAIARKTLMIDTSGAVIGQVNALTVRDVGDHVFGTPARVTARASVGRRGVINIERDVALGGPIQQKGAMVLQGFLAGHFARRIPLSFNCSITFEQSYGGVEGDSASLAELCATLSDLSGLKLRQDLAITGSVNQRGQSQAVGGVHHKVEGFFRTCVEAGGLTGTQGVIMPEANAVNLVLRDDVTAAIAAGKFHLWSVATIDEAIELFTGTPAGVPDAKGNYPADTIYGRVAAQLTEFDTILTQREIAESAAG